MVTIERLGEGGWQILRDVRLAALQEAPEAFWATWQDQCRWEREDWVRFTHAVVWFVAVDDRRPGPLQAGLVGCLRREEFPDEPEVVGLWVRPEERGVGTADLLIGAAHRWAVTQGVRSLVLWVVDGNERARRFYERHLYVPTGERAPLPVGRAGQEHRMRRTWATPPDGAARAPEILQSPSPRWPQPVEAWENPR
jgi:GNAT superfamily N-acetyltransferase